MIHINKDTNSISKELEDFRQFLEWKTYSTEVLENNPGLNQNSAKGKIPGAEKLLLTLEEAGHRLSVGRSQIYRLVADGLLESVTIRKSRRIPVDALNDFVNSLKSRHATSIQSNLNDPVISLRLTNSERLINGNDPDAFTQVAQ